MSRFRIVTPYRAFPPESEQHKALPDFDWIDALRMVTHTAGWANHCDVRVLTDTTTELPVKAFHYPTTSTRLTLWILEIRARYLESVDFDRDTVIVDADELIFGDVSRWFSDDLGVLIRSNPKHQGADAWPLLNGVQWWRVKAKKKLARFYWQALEMAQQMSEDRIVWGSETDAVRALLEPLVLGGPHKRSGLKVRMIEAEDVLETFSTGHVQALEAGEFPWPRRPILDFRWTRKQHMRAAYEATALAGAAV